MRPRVSVSGGAGWSCGPGRRRSKQIGERDQRDRTSAPRPRWCRRPTPCTSIPPADRRRGGRSRSSKMVRERTSNGKEYRVERSAGDEVRRHQHGLGRTNAGSARPDLRAKPRSTARPWWSRPCRRSPTCLLDTMRHAEGGEPRSESRRTCTARSPPRRGLPRLCLAGRPHVRTAICDMAESDRRIPAHRSTAC